jgi:hypothetical protein
VKLRREICAVAAVAALAAAAPAHAERVAVVVVPRFPLERYAGEGAVGLLVPGAGSTVTRAGALAALVRGTVRNSALVGGLPTGKPTIRLARRPGPVTIYVALPPPGTTHNVHRYPIAIVGGGYHGLLESSATRIPGLVSIADVAPTAVALAAGRPARIRSRPAADAPAELRALDGRLAEVHDARAPARVTVVGLLLAALFGAALFRSRTIARAGVLVGPAALTAVLLLSAAHQARIAVVVGALIAAGAAGLLVARLGDRAAALAAVAVVVAAIVVLAHDPALNALAAIGPHPDGGGRYYGVTNEVETLLLAPTLLAAAVLGLWAGIPALLLVGWSRAGADGGGLLVFAAALGMLWFRRSGRRVTGRGLALGAAAVVAAALVLVGLDAVTGGSSHVTHAIASGPSGWWDEAAHRWEVSWAGATSSWPIWVQTFGSLLALLVFALVWPRSATVDALLVGLAVSLVVNDTPQDVLAFGALTCAPLVLWARLPD